VCYVVPVLLARSLLEEIGAFSYVRAAQSEHEKVKCELVIKT
jgi:hypothetical protein